MISDIVLRTNFFIGHSKYFVPALYGIHVLLEYPVFFNIDLKLFYIITFILKKMFPFGVPLRLINLSQINLSPAFPPVSRVDLASF